MNWIVAYDISSDRRRARVAAVLSAWGDRVQKSVFECTLDTSELTDVLHRIDSEIDPAVDSVRVYRQCLPCDAGIITIGQAETRHDQPFWIV